MWLDLVAAPVGGTTSGEWITRLFMGLAALVGAFTAYRVAKRDSNADALKEAVSDLQKAKRRIEDLEADMIALHQHEFALRQILASSGIASPQPPVLRSDRT